ncbi:MAG: hypothetical protein OXR67_11245 [Chloroflexota bacterium]|nr:hypothetical protein [Chloroflexota bacterium]
MSAVTNASIPLRAFGAVLVLTLIAAVAVTITLTAGPTQAQNATNNTYDDPQPCGLGAATAFQPEPHEITKGHFALFDVYWQRTGTSTGLLRTNTCPPNVTQTTELDRDGNETTTTSLLPSGIDIREAIFHILDKHEATVVSGADTSGGAHGSGDAQISTDDYRRLGEYVSIGDPVWWLRLDDAGLSDAETENLSLGFSTERFSYQYWATEDNSPPFRYMFELERNPGIDPAKHPHFLAYRTGASGMELVWNSAAVHTQPLEMEPGQFEHLEWIFTQPGTYELWVHLRGEVRGVDNVPVGAGDDWAPISNNETETNEVRRYVIQVGDRLAEHEPPRFGFSYTIDENTPPGTEVAQPSINVLTEEPTDLEFSLSGEGADDFALDSTSSPDRVKIRVADDANLDFERQPDYDLLLNVTDNIDHESNPDPSIDHFIAIQIELNDIKPSVRLVPSKTNPAKGESVHLTIVWENFEEVVGEYDWVVAENDSSFTEGTSDQNNAWIWSGSHEFSHTGIFVLTVTYRSAPDGPTTDLTATATVEWPD